MKRSVITLFIVLVILAIVLCTVNRTRAASDTVTVSGELTDVMTYYNTVEVSAYYPSEDGYDYNHRDVPLTSLVDDIIATQTKGGHSQLLGKTVVLVTPDGQQLTRKVDDRGCYPGRLDLLVENGASMDAWGLKFCEVWILEE